MRTLIEMDKCLETVQHMEQITENEGIFISISFDVTDEDFYGITKMMSLEPSTTTIEGANYMTGWQVNKRLNVSFYSYGN